MRPGPLYPLFLYQDHSCYKRPIQTLTKSNSTFQYDDASMLHHLLVSRKFCYDVQENSHTHTDDNAPFLSGLQRLKEASTGTFSR